MSEATASKMRLEDVTVEISEEEVMVDLDPAILMWEKVFTGSSTSVR